MPRGKRDIKSVAGILSIAPIHLKSTDWAGLAAMQPELRIVSYLTSIGLDNILMF
jgi:hypothetical protein